MYINLFVSMYETNDKTISNKMMTGLVDKIVSVFENDLLNIRVSSMDDVYLEPDRNVLLKRVQYFIEKKNEFNWCFPHFLVNLRIYEKFLPISQMLVNFMRWRI